MPRRDFIAEIERKRTRNRLHPIGAPLRLGVIEDALRRVRGDAELLRYFPVALVAVIETFIRKAIQQLIDNRPQALDGFLASPTGKDQRFDLTILRAVAGKQISVGELLGHLIPIKSLESIDAAMTSVLGQPFLPVLRTVHDRWAVEIHGKPKQPIIPDLDAVLERIATLFSDRHILAHEDADNYELTFHHVDSQLNATAAFLDAASELVSNVLYPDAPLTQVAMNQAAAEATRDATTSMIATIDALRPRLSTSMLAALDQSQAAWLAYRDAQSRLEGLEFEGGSMQPMIESSAQETLTTARIVDLNRVLMDIPD